MFFHDSVMKRLALTGGQMQVERILTVRTKPKLIGNMGFELWTRSGLLKPHPEGGGCQSPPMQGEELGRSSFPGLPRPLHSCCAGSRRSYRCTQHSCTKKTTSTSTKWMPALFVQAVYKYP